VINEYNGATKDTLGNEFLAYLSGKVMDEKNLTPSEKTLWNTL